MTEPASVSVSVVICCGVGESAVLEEGKGCLVG